MTKHGRKKHVGSTASRSRHARGVQTAKSLARLNAWRRPRCYGYSVRFDIPFDTPSRRFAETVLTDFRFVKIPSASDRHYRYSPRFYGSSKKWVRALTRVRHDKVVWFDRPTTANKRRVRARASEFNTSLNTVLDTRRGREWFRRSHGSFVAGNASICCVCGYELMSVRFFFSSLKRIVWNEEKKHSFSPEISFERVKNTCRISIQSQSSKNNRTAVRCLKFLIICHV